MTRMRSRVLARDVRQGRVSWAFLLVAVAVVCSSLSIYVQDQHIYQVSHECVDMLPLPAVAFVYAWSAVILALAALVIGIVSTATRSALHRRGFVISGGWIAPSLVTVSTLVLLFAIFVLYTAFQESILVPNPCSG